MKAGITVSVQAEHPVESVYFSMENGPLCLDKLRTSVDRIRERSLSRWLRKSIGAGVHGLMSTVHQGSGVIHGKLELFTNDR